MNKQTRAWQAPLIPIKNLYQYLLVLHYTLCILLNIKIFNKVSLKMLKVCLKILFA